jgi:hypothetical protein
VAETFGRQSAPLVRQARSNRPPTAPIDALSTPLLFAQHDFLRRPLSVGTHPTVTTCKANIRKTMRFRTGPRKSRCVALLSAPTPQAPRAARWRAERPAKKKPRSEGVSQLGRFHWPDLEMACRAAHSRSCAARCGRTRIAPTIRHACAGYSR